MVIGGHTVDHGIMTRLSLRLSILESGGVPVAGAYGRAFANKAFRLKSGFDERYADHSPGLVLLGEELRRSIAEGLHAFEFLGVPDAHTLRWGAPTQDLITLRAYRGPTALATYAYQARLRPLLGNARRMIPRAFNRGGRDSGG
jgi:CelD/BcsL family acetyltransferase involved in cellulose biosynthesis